MKMKVVSFALGLSLLAGLLAACNQDTGGTGGNTSPSPGSEPAGTLSDPSPSPTGSP